MGHGIEADDGGDDFGCCGFALHADGPDHDLARKTVCQAVQDVADDCTRGRGNDADFLWQIRQRFFAVGVKQAFGSEFAFPLLKQRHQGAHTCGLYVFDDDLVRGLAWVGRELARGDDFEAFLQLCSHAAETATPDHGVDFRSLVFQRKVAVA